MRARLFLFMAVVGVLPLELRATQVIPVNVSHLVSAAGVVFSGRCLSRRVEVQTSDQFPRGLITTTYTFSIDRCIKGQCQGATYTFSQWGGRAEECAALGRSCPVAMTQYVEGNDYVLFLAPTPRLTSPIGLGQGVFDVVTTSAGTKMVRNAYFKSSLLANVPDRPAITKTLAAAKTRFDEAKSEMPLDDFFKVVEGLKHP